jgi:hypothetical protein
MSFKIIFIQKSQIYVFRESSNFAQFENVLISWFWNQIPWINSKNNYAAIFIFGMSSFSPSQFPFHFCQPKRSQANPILVLFYFLPRAQQGLAFGPLVGPSPLLFRSPLVVGAAARSGWPPPTCAALPLLPVCHKVKSCHILFPF